VPSENSIDEALEEVWRRRLELPEMGRLAAEKIRTLVSSNPAKDFAETLIEIATQVRAAKVNRTRNGLGEDGLIREQAS
jgi:hypothetical protein